MSFTTLGGIRDFVKAELRITASDMDSYINARVNNNYSSRAAMYPWKDTLVLGTTFATASTQQNYNLASDFTRLVKNSVRWGVTATSQGTPLPDVPFEQTEYYKGACSTQQPYVCTVIGASTGSGKQLQLIPPFTTSSSVVSYDYYAGVAELTADTSALRVAELGAVVAYDTCADVQNYLGRDPTYYRQEAKDNFNAAFQNVLPG